MGKYTPTVLERRLRPIVKPWIQEEQCHGAVDQILTLPRRLWEFDHLVDVYSVGGCHQNFCCCLLGLCITKARVVYAVYWTPGLPLVLLVMFFDRISRRRRVSDLGTLGLYLCSFLDVLVLTLGTL